MSKYLDDSGLSYLWSKLKAKFDSKADSISDGIATRAAGILFGQVDSTSTSTKFTAQISGVTEYYDGLAIMLRNGVVTSASGFTININGLGEKASYSSMATGATPTRDTTIFNIAYTMLFVYSSTIVEGGAFIMYRGYDANTNTIGYQLRTNSSTMPMKQITYRYRILFTSLDGQGWVPSNTSTSTNATAKRDVNQAVIDPFGEIVYYGTTASVAVGSNPSAAYLWQEYTLTLGYAFNRTGAALVLPFPKPIYIKCAPQSGGGAIIDADEPYVFTLPSTEDGKIYIYLGRTYSATAIEMTMNHPVYYYKDGAIREWTNPVASSGGGAVDSVNGQTGTVVLDADDVGALPDDTVIPTKTSDLTNDSGFITSASVPSAATANPLMDGTAAVGSSSKWAKEDHVHPLDTSRVPVSNTQDTETSTITNAGFRTVIQTDSSDTDTMSQVTSHYEFAELYSTGNANGTIYSSVKSQGQSVILSANDFSSSPSKTNTLTISPASTTIHNVATPTANGDAANKQYVDNAIAGISVPTAATAKPLMDGTATVGTSSKYAKEDHVHPTDTSRQATLVSGTNIKTINNESILGSGNINIQGGSGLPTVTTADNGKVLMVVNGAWAAASLPIYDGTVV